MQVNSNSYSIQELLQASHQRRAETGLEKNSIDFKPFGDDGLGFDDLLDIINPLQHLPIIGHIYRELSGDGIETAAKIAGAALYGGPIGAAFSIASSLFSTITDDTADAADSPASPAVASAGLAANSDRYATLEQRIKDMYSLETKHSSEVSTHHQNVGRKIDHQI